MNDIFYGLMTLALRIRIVATAMVIGIAVLLQGQDIEVIQLGSENNQEGPIIWSGKIYSEEDNKGIVSALIRSDNGVNTITDLEGNFSISLEEKRYTIAISALGFEEKVFDLMARSSQELSIGLAVEVQTIDEVVVSGQNDRDQLTEIIPGLQRMNIEQLELQSKFFGEIDILRSLQSISGVSNTGEGASGFNVRGGNADQNLILQDGHLIFNPSHALGFFSLFHPDLVQYVDLYKGGIPSKYGGRLSSVLSVQTRDGNKEKLKAKGGIGLVSSRLSIEGPIVKDKLSFIVGSRYSYANWIFDFVDDPILKETRSFFNDISGKINGRITPTTSVGISFLRSEDDFQFGNETRFDYQTVSGEAYIKQLVGNKVNLTLRANKGQYMSSLFDLKGNDQSKFTNTIDYLRGGLDMLYVLSDDFKLNLGAEAVEYEVNPGKVSPIGNSIIVPDELDSDKGREVSFYVESQFNLNSSLEISAGLRYTTYDNLGPATVNNYPEGQIKTVRNITGQTSFAEGESIAQYSGLEPRFSLLYQFDDQSSIKAGYARTYQYLAQISNTASATPIDIWQLANQHVESQFSDNFSIGYFRSIEGKKYEASLEGFYRSAEGILDYKDFAELLLNKNIETELVSGEGISYGVELNFRKKLGDLRWDANYTFSSSERRIIASNVQPGVNRGEWYSSNYDIPHVLNISVVKDFGKKSNISANFTYRSGRPTTAPVSSYTNENIVNIPIYSDRNKFRVPAFHRLDIAYTYGPFGKKDGILEHSFTISVYNLYSRKNAYSVYFRQNPFDSVKAIRVSTLGSIFPSITYNFNFK